MTGRNAIGALRYREYYDEYAAKSGLAKAFIEKVQSMKK